VFVHPTAPLYALTAYAAAPRSRRVARSMIREAWPGALALLVARAVLPAPRITLGDRYGLGTAKAGGRTFTGRRSGTTRSTSSH
jgi:hypothetical protein